MHGNVGINWAGVSKANFVSEMVVDVPSFYIYTHLRTIDFMRWVIRESVHMGRRPNQGTSFSEIIHFLY
jgi:hypothetical protein